MKADIPYQCEQSKQNGHAVRINCVTKNFGPNEVLKGISLSAGQGEFLTLLGPSGCGKTTLLNLIAGFFFPERGTIEINGENVTGLPPHQRNTAMVFQNYALFPHLTVEDNVGFGLRIRKGIDRSESRKRVAEVLSKVKMTGTEARYPHELSGGQQQRVALARALVLHPSVLLLDEPLSNLDANLREAMQLELRNLQRELGITTILVTHDQAEAFVVADRIAVMHVGMIEQLGTPDEIYRAPNSRFVAEFIGRMNWLPAIVADGHQLIATMGDNQIRVQLAKQWPIGLEGHFLLRPEDVRLSKNSTAPVGELRGHVVSRVFLGPTTQYHVRIGETVMLADSQGGSCHPLGPVYVSWDVARGHFLPNEPLANS